MTTAGLSSVRHRSLHMLYMLLTCFWHTLQRRHSPLCSELMYVCNGDTNGVCHFLGTAYGTQKWVNPVVAGRMEV